MLHLLFLGTLPWITYVTAVNTPPPPLNSSTNTKYEWTALGDSLASGDGSTKYESGMRCLRYNQAYPALINKDSYFSKDQVFHNAACNGAQTSDVIQWQLLDQDTSAKPNDKYGSRPKFGNPTIATLTVGAENTDFAGIFFSCILEQHIWGGPPKSTCADQKLRTWGFLNAPKLVDDIDHAIQQVVAKGRKGPIGNSFQLFVTGYPTYFNQDDPGCNTVTFARSANPKPDGKQHTMLTTDLRKELNDMTVVLNNAVRQAVTRNANDGVRFIDIERNIDGSDALAGHRFCEPGIQEPDEQNQNLWLWHYPYAEANDKTGAHNSDWQMSVLQDAWNSLSIDGDMNTQYPNDADLRNAVYGNIDRSKLKKDSKGDPKESAFWAWVGVRARLFHPQLAYQDFIHKRITGCIGKNPGVDGC
ncbi:MAG: hypothetical protein Q9157_006154 [Trypethelium eluteriae]